jgi:hypothetical protein
MQTQMLDDAARYAALGRRRGILGRDDLRRTSQDRLEQDEPGSEATRR